MTAQKIIITLGILFIIIGMLFPYISKLGLGKLPGDIYFGSKNLKFFFPITTTILLSALISIILWVWRKF
jgi:ribose/xylose/arabinose/galactoside ABC-type transport system permease subunit